MKKFYLTFASLLFAFLGAHAQYEPGKPGNGMGYDQHETFNPYFYNQVKGTEYRSANGAPGPKYWQNHPDYKIVARLDTVTNMLTGTVTITYKNNSPDVLGFLWLQVDQNLFKADSRSNETTHTPTGQRFSSRPDFVGGYNIKSITVQKSGKSEPVEWVFSDTRMRVNLPRPVKGGGDSVKLVISYSFPIPAYGVDRMGKKYTKDGTEYQFAQWYPRMCVYDDIRGWDTLPYLGAGEFYLEYGDFDYTVTTPANMVVVGSGALVNSAEVLTKTVQERLAKAALSDKTINIRSQSDINNPAAQPAGKKELTWHFKMHSSRDVAWAASSAFMWDAARINLPSGKKALAQAVYGADAKDPESWGGATESVKQVIEYYSNTLYEFPWPVATAVGGNLGGMEYPGIIFCSGRPGGGRAWSIVNHEFGHNWFPMLVGSNERRYTFMDEGFDTFINGLNAKQHVTPAPAIPPVGAPAGARGGGGGRGAAQDMYSIAQTYYGPAEEPIISYEDVLQFGRIGVEGYRKPSIALNLLRNDVVGEKLFDMAFKNYVKLWAFKHPTPDDFFRVMENGTGEDLGWFWRGFFFNTWKLDQAVTAVTYIDKADPAKGISITVKNLGKIAMPVTVEVKEEGGTTGRIKLPVEIWQRGDTWTFPYASKGKVISVTLDPDKAYPDINPANNVFKM